MPPLLPWERWALTPPFHPYRLHGGIFSVALSVTVLTVPRLATGILPFGVRTFLTTFVVRMRMYDCPQILGKNGGEGRIKKGVLWGYKSQLVVNAFRQRLSETRLTFLGVCGCDKSKVCATNGSYGN